MRSAVNPPVSFKVTILGKVGVGKTSLKHRRFDLAFATKYARLDSA